MYVVLREGGFEVIDVVLAGWVLVGGRDDVFVDLDDLHGHR